MTITEIHINLRDEDKLKAFVNITFDDVFVVRGLKIIEGKDGLFVCMPSRKLEDGTYKDIAHPITNEFRRQIETQILDEFRRQSSDSADRPVAPGHGFLGIAE
ncbi:MAG: septation protein SpoVG family protein [Calditrichaeota bacterium]|nr:septation protein SpoVG family protein [Calditrichota bacterium]MCB9366854.1 septation protein SpoVG family protein [Calditrichota bacterium]